MLEPSSEEWNCSQRHMASSQAASCRIIRPPSLKRGRADDVPINEKVKLERVLGLTTTSNAGLACDPHSGLIAYPAGCTVVLFNPKKNKQTHLVNQCRKSLSSLTFSPDGRFVATGECGHQPCVRIWDTHDRTQVAEFSGHKYGINCVAFSPNHKYVVSVGSQHDMIVNVWDWKTDVKVASNKVSSKVKSISFAENGSYFVTVGNRHVKFWYLQYSRSAKYKDPVPLMGRSAILGEQRNNYFCDVGCGRGDMGDSTYAITKSGLLCEFNNRRLLDKWVELRTSSANCMAVGEEYIFVGCAQGIVRCFSPFTLQFVTTLPRTHYLGVDVASGLTISHMASHPNNAKYPDCIAVAFDETNHKVTCVYNDHSVYVWDVRDVRRVGKSHSFLYHSACIWGLDMVPPSEDSKGGEALPPGSFATCSSDDTVRIWNVDPGSAQNDSGLRRNIYSNELLKIIYVDPDLTYLKDTDTPAVAGGDQTQQQQQQQQQQGAQENNSYDGCNGVRCIRISPDGRHLASGDRSGNIRIHLLRDWSEKCKIEAHDAEVLCLEYTKKGCPYSFLATASRDRLIHVFDVGQGYQFVQTLDDHSSSITAVRFVHGGGQLQMVSGGADKSIIFRQLQTGGGTGAQFARGHNAAVKTTLYDMEVDSGQKHLLAACQDRSIRIYNVSSGKHSRTFKGSPAEDGTLIKVSLDNSGIYVATSCTDKTMSVYDYISHDCMAVMQGHSELVTGLRFSNDCRHLVSVSGDGCIFVWKVPHEMVVTMQARLNTQAARAAKESRRGTFVVQRPSPNQMDATQLQESMAPPPPPDYRFSVGQLPLWAKKQMSDGSSAPGLQTGSANKSHLVADFPKGRWAQRVDTAGITVKSFYDSDSVIPYPQQPGDKRLSESDGSKDSSVESNPEVRQFSEYKSTQSTIIISKMDADGESGFEPCADSLREIEQGAELFKVSPGSVTQKRGGGEFGHRTRHFTDDSSVSGSYRCELQDVESSAHDGDVEDYSEGEHEDGNSTEPEQSERLMYYPQAEDTGSDFTVNAMDAEELRRSQRRHKKTRPERPTDIPVLAVSGSQESDDDDDDDASTPSADTAEKNLLSMLSASTESLDQVDQREKYLKSNFESLSGAENEDGDTSRNKNSISSLFLTTRSSHRPPRNVDVINALQQTKNDSGITQNREELNRRLAETRKKLESIGFKSLLKGSQSISDLSNIPEKDVSMSPGRMGVRLNRADSSSGMRRACSLSDLSQNPQQRRLLPNPPVKVSGKKVSSGPTWSMSSRQSLSTQNANMSRSSSVGILNQSDSESDASVIHRAPSAASLSRVSSSLLRPTISSQNKVASKTGNTVRRRSLSNAISAGDLRKAGNEDSSSEEGQSICPINGPTNGPSNGPRAAPPGCPQQMSKTAREVTQRLTQSGANNYSVNNPPKVARRPTLIPPGNPPPGVARRPTTLGANMGANAGANAGAAMAPPPVPPRIRRDKSPDQFPVRDGQVSPVTPHLCESTAEMLQEASQRMLHLHQRVTGDRGMGQGERQQLLQLLSNTAAQVQCHLQVVSGTPVGTPSGNPSSFPPPGNTTLPGNLMLGNNANFPPVNFAANTSDVNSPYMVQMMQQYSEMLLSLVQQRMGPGDGSADEKQS